MIDEATVQARATRYVLEQFGLSDNEFKNLDSPIVTEITDYISRVMDDMRFNYMKYFRPIPYQVDFFNMKDRRKGLIAANRSGKTVSTCMELAYHLTGRYPDWWKGRKFKANITAIAAGESWQQVSLAIQNELLGTSDSSDIRKLGSGSIPKNAIDFTSIKKIQGIARSIRIKHNCGQNSELIFANYSQKDKNLQGFKAHVVLIDEQPPEEVYRELTMRAATTDGTVLCSFTPLKGFSPLVSNFWENKEGFNHIRVKWDDVPEYDLWGQPLFLNTTRQMLISEMQPWEVGPRTEGIPMRGHGSVFNIHPMPTYRDGDYDFIAGKYNRIISVDLASQSDNTVITLAYWDEFKNTAFIDTQFIFKPGEQSRFVNWKNYLTYPGFKDVPIVLPSDGSQKGRYTESASSIRELLLAEGLNVYETSINSKFKVEKGEVNTISYGISKMSVMMSQGQLHINEKCSQLLKDMQSYHIDDKGNYKGVDDCIDSARYALLGCIIGISRPIEYSKIANRNKFNQMIEQTKKNRLSKLPVYKQPIWIN